jgi:polyhydroxyalkanoate synthase
VDRRRAPEDRHRQDPSSGGSSRRAAHDHRTDHHAGHRGTRRPGTTGRRLDGLAAELARIGVGSSTVAPSRRDRRFADPAWADNPLLRRVVQAYLAAGQTAEQLVGDAELGWRDEQRARFLAENLVETLSSNLPLVNPASAKAAIDTAGPEPRTRRAEPAAGPGQPAAGPGDGGRVGLQVGGNLALTPGAVVLRTELL